MAGLSNLKLAMGSSIFITGFIFALFLSAIFFLLSVPLIFALIGTGLFILFQYLVGPTIVKASTRLQYIKPGENPWLENTVKNLAGKSGIPMPKLAIVPNNTPNAFTFGRTSSSATLALHQGLLDNLNENEVAGVIGHELGHIKHKDYIIMTILSALPLIAYLVAQVAFRAGVFSSYSGNRKNQGNATAALIVVGVISFVVYIVSFLAVMRLSRLREHYADAYSAYLTSSPRSLESGLAKITYGLSLSPKVEDAGTVRAFFIEDPHTAKQEIQEIMDKKSEYDLDHDGVLDERELELAMEKEAKSTWRQLNTLFATHPPTFKRILLLKEIENEMQTGKYTGDRIYNHV